MTETLVQQTSHRQPTGGNSRGRPGALRRCIASGELHAQRDLLRFVVGPGGNLVLDLAGKLPGRGLWLLPRRNMLEKARIRRLFARAARAPVAVPEDLTSQVVRALRERCLDLLGLARRAGELAVGHDKVRSWLSTGRGAVLVQAADAAEGGRRKVRALAQAASPGLPVVEAFVAEELGRALGRDAAVHVVMAPGGLADRFLADFARLKAVAADLDERDKDVSA